MNARHLLLPAVALLGFAPRLAHAAGPQFSHEFETAWLKSDEVDERTLAARYKVGLREDFAGADLTGYWFARSAGTLALKTAANSENITAEGGLGLWRRVGGTVKLELGAPIDPTASNPVPAVQAGSHDVLFNVDLKVGYETDQSFDNTQWTAGPRIGFTHTENQGFWPLLPSVQIAYQRIGVIESQFLTERRIPEDSSWRLEIDAAWKWRPFERSGTEAAWLKPIGLHADIRYFQSYSVPGPVRRLGLDDNVYTAGTVSYETTQLGWKYVRQVFVRVAQGRLPPSTRSDTTLFIGVTLTQ